MPTTSSQDNQPSLETLLRRYAAPVLRLALWLTGDGTDADRLTYRAFVVVHKNQSSIRPDAVIERAKKKVLELFLADSQKWDGTTPLEAEPPACLDQAVDVKSGLRCLPPAQRAALVLYDIEGYNYEAAAELLSMPVEELYRKVTLGREILQAVLPHSTEEAASDSDDPRMPVFPPDRGSDPALLSMLDQGEEDPSIEPYEASIMPPRETLTTPVDEDYYVASGKENEDHFYGSFNGPNGVVVGAQPTSRRRRYRTLGRRIIRAWASRPIMRSATTIAIIALCLASLMFHYTEGSIAWITGSGPG